VKYFADDAVAVEQIQTCNSHKFVDISFFIL